MKKITYFFYVVSNEIAQMPKYTSVSLRYMRPIVLLLSFITMYQGKTRVAKWCRKVGDIRQRQQVKRSQRCNLFTTRKNI